MSRLVLVTAVALLLTAPIGAAGAIAPQPTDVVGMVGMATTGPVDTPTPVTSYPHFTALFGSSTAGLANPHLGPSVAAFFANGGSSLYVVRVADASDAAFIGIDAGPGARTGLEALREIDEISLVAAPGNTSLAVQQALILQCQALGDRMAILDCAADADVASVQDHRAALVSAEGFAAFYFPWVQASPTGPSLLLPPSGFVAGIAAATEANASPVGAIATATDVAVDVTTTDQENLNPLGINAIRDFGAQGIRVFGARTLATSLEWIYIATRRIQMHLEESIREGTAWAVNETNDAILWASLEAQVDAFLHDRYLAGWFQGTSPSEAYFARCNLSTMTQTDLDEGRTIVQIGYAPLRPAEFHVFSVVHERGTGTAAPSSARGSRLLPASPNPFNPRTSIRFVTGSGGPVSLRAYDLQGRLVATLFEGDVEAGPRHFDWDARGLASGVYLVTLRDASGVSTQKVALVK